MEGIKIPKWIIESVIDTLKLVHQNIEDECCLKRQIASAYKKLKLYINNDIVTDDDINKVIIDYLNCNID